MRRLILTVVASVVYSCSLSATHLAGAEIFYRYIGDSTGVKHQYYVSLNLYRDNALPPGTTTGLPSTVSICYSSSCYPGGETVIGRKVPPANLAAGDGGYIIPTLDECVDSSSSSWVRISRHRYRGFVVLDGPCHDWKFTFQHCCRNHVITNFVNPGSHGFDIVAELNNLDGPNNSPRFITPAAKAFCVNLPFNWRQFSKEVDGDSLHTHFGLPSSYTAQIGLDCPDPSYYIPFAPGYSVNAPMKTTSGILTDPATGTFRFTPSQVEVDVIKVDVVEYRFDTVMSQWYQVGKVTRELQVPIYSDCSTVARNGPAIDVGALSSKSWQVPVADLQKVRDSIRGYGIEDIHIHKTFGTGLYEIPLVPYSCYDTLITLRFNSKTRVDCESISADGTDFRLLGPDSIARPIVKALYQCDASLTTDEIHLVLHKPLDVNGNYIFYIKQGSDGNTLINRCGFELDEFYTMILQVDSCPILDYKLDNVSVHKDQYIDIAWRADTNTFVKHLFGNWNILRAGKAGRYKIVDQLDDIDARSYRDKNLAKDAVDLQSFGYSVQLVQNGSRRRPTNEISAILLQGTPDNDAGTLYLNWSPYHGWPNPDYELFVGRGDPQAMNVQWESYAGPSHNMFESEFKLPWVNKANSGIYAWKVVASDPDHPRNPYLSESNWYFFELLLPGIPDVEFPNVISPNGDGQNDVFYFPLSENIKIELSIYNRWGQLVFEDTQFKLRNNQIDGWDGTDMNTGQKLADGVYYYVARLYDTASGNELNKHGSVTLLGGAN